MLGGVVAWWVVALVGCAGGDFRPAQLGRDEGMIYVYRRAGAGLGGIDVYVDQNLRASLTPGRHVGVRVAPGEHLVRAERRRESTRRTIVPPGGSVILEVSAGWFGQVALMAPNQDDARTRITATREVPRSELVDKSESQSDAP